MNPLAPLPVVVPLFAAAIITGLGDVLSRRTASAMATFAAAAVGAVCLVLVHQSRNQTIVYWFGAWVPRSGVALGISFAIDQIGAGLAALVAVLVVAAFVFSFSYFDTNHHRFHVLMLVFLAAMCGFALTGDLFNLFVYFELMSAVAFALCGYKTEEATVLEGSINFAVTNTVAAFLVLLAIGLLYGHTGALNFAQIGRAIAGHPDRLVAVSFALLAGGFMVKSAIVPFHFWLPDAHAVAPTPVCILFSGVMVELGLYAIARLYWTVFAPSLAPSAPLIRDLLIAIGAGTALVGGVMAFLQVHLKRLLAFSTIAHAGLMLIGIGLLGAAGISGTAIYVLGHGLVKAALFLSAGIVLHRTGSVDERRLRGAGAAIPAAGVLFLLGGLGLAGLPPFATFSGEQGIAEAALHYAWLPWLFAVTAVLTAGAVFRVTARVFLGWGPLVEPKPAGTGETDEEKPETAGGHDVTPWQMVSAPAALIALAVAVGVAPALVNGAMASAQRFVSSADYWRQVMYGAGSGVQPVTQHASLAPELVRAVLRVAGAAVLAAASLNVSLRTVPGGIRRAGRAVAFALHSVHSGRVTDYVAWLMLGIGGLMLALTLMI